MKKSLLFILIALLVSSCKCTRTQDLNLENAIAKDKEYMYLNYDSSFVWYESSILMQDFLDQDPSGKILGISNVFQASVEGQPRVVTIVHSAKGDSVIVKHDFWIEDLDMMNDTIKLTYKEAFDKAMQSNCIKPHSQYCVLRKELGPKDINPQYIFGNSQAQIYIDAITGDVSDTDPAF